MEQDGSPKNYSVSENVVMTAKLLGGMGFIGGVLWTLTAFLE
jgi:hypothetical protein